MPASTAHQSTITQPPSAVAAPRAGKASWPSQPFQVVQAIRIAAKPCLKLALRPRVVRTSTRVFHPISLLRLDGYPILTFPTDFYFVSYQSAPIPTSTCSGTLRAIAPSISSRSTAAIASASDCGRFDHQFVVDLQQHLHRQGLRADAAVQVDHRELDQVGGGALHDAVDGQAFAQRGICAVA